jgi:thymidylate kinase
MISVEFIGVPGSGKSTVMRALVKALQESDSGVYLTTEDALFIAAKERIDRSFRMLLNFLPGSIARVFFDRLSHRSFWQNEGQGVFLAKNYQALQCVLASNEFNVLPTKDKATVLSSFLKSGGAYECISQVLTSNETVFFDEGLLQKSVMFVSPYIKSKSYEYVHEYITNIPLPDIVVHFDLDNTVCYERMLRRDKGLTDRLKENTSVDYLRFMDNAKKHLETLALMLRAENKIKLINISTISSLDETVTSLTNKISSSLNSLYGEKYE